MGFAHPVPGPGSVPGARAWPPRPAIPWASTGMAACRGNSHGGGWRGRTSSRPEHGTPLPGVHISGAGSGPTATRAVS